MILPGLPRAAALALCLTVLAGSASPARAAGGPGDIWTVTTSFTAMGMTIGGTTTEVCVSRVDPQAPMAMDPGCRVLERRRIGNRETARFRCDADGMEGTLEMEHLGPDRYRGRSVMKSRDGEMTGTWQGQKTGRRCDAAAEEKSRVETVKRIEESARAQEAAAIRKHCSDTAEKLSDPHALFGLRPDGGAPMCNDPGDKAVLCKGAASKLVHLDLFAAGGTRAAVCSEPVSRQALCSNAVSEAGRRTLIGQHFRVADIRRSYPEATSALLLKSEGLGQADLVPQTCGIDAATWRDSVCEIAEKDRNADYLLERCPARAEAVARRECTGRRLTSGDPVTRICEAYAGQLARSGGGVPATPGTATSPTAQPPAQPARNDAVRNAIREGLRGIFGR